jgi:hypothetical protein
MPDKAIRSGGYLPRPPKAPKSQNLRFCTPKNFENPRGDLSCACGPPARPRNETPRFVRKVRWGSFFRGFPFRGRCPFRGFALDSACGTLTPALIECDSLGFSFVWDSAPPRSDFGGAFSRNRTAKPLHLHCIHCGISPFANGAANKRLANPPLHWPPATASTANSHGNEFERAAR